jgi:hypothetical protein
VRVRPRVFVAFVLASGLIACAGLTGLSDFEFFPATADGGMVETLPDGAVVVIHPSGDASRDGSPNPVDANVPDSGVDAAPICPGAVTAGPSVLAKSIAAGAITVDGKDEDWPCAPKFRLDQTNMGGTYDPAGVITSSAELSAAWNADGLYVIIHVTESNALVENDTTLNYLNDAVELYISPTADPSGNYPPHAFHMATDFTGLTKYYNGGYNPPGIVTAAMTVSGGYVVEAFVPAPGLFVPMAAGGSIHFDLQIDEHATSAPRAAYWLYGVKGGGPGSCGSSVIQPSCTTSLWGGLEFSP